LPPLVIVESPTKARTIKAFLPRGYRVEASMGHIRDLPEGAKDIPAKYKGEEWARLGVNVERDFEPLYVVPASKKKVVQALKQALREADELILATDEDREGESISWHLVQELKPRVPVRRMVFHEITREAIEEALATTRPIDDRLVRAQETRRILDRLVGYTLSPLLWRKIAWGLSAGRVQSVAVRLLVQRERERRAFRSGVWWDLEARLRHAGQEFKAQLVQLRGTRVATGKDFDPRTGEIAKGKEVLLLDQQGAETLREELARLPWIVSAVEEKPQIRRPWAPFITSTLQQEASRKLRLSARETMRLAQGLYERGFITYMRTDSVHLSQQAIAAARECIAARYGREFLPAKPRHYTNRAAHTQEAHEAIRPAGARFRLPEETGLTGVERDLYELIWKRTVASQMADARMTSLGVTLSVGQAVFRATGKRIDFPGFLRAYVEGTDDPEAALEDQEVLLPHLREGDRPACEALEAQVHQTQPPPRFTEATLIRELEADGVGRPSTYATILGTILERGYAFKQGQALVPTFTAIAVTLLLEKHFHELVDIKFTARMEQTLDDIAEGKAEWLPYLEQFFKGEAGLLHQVAEKTKSIDPAEARRIELRGLDATVRIGRFGPYIEREGADNTATRVSVPQDIPPADLTRETIDSLIQQKQGGPTLLGHHPETGQPVYLLTGQYGPYVQLGDTADGAAKPKRVSVPRGVAPAAVTFQMALGLLSLPRLLGTHPETGAPVLAGLGRFGPFVVHDRGKTGKDYRSLKAEDDVLTVTLERALELLAQPKRGRGRRATPSPARDLGPHPADGEAVQLFQGRYGPYLKHGSTTASIPPGKDPTTLSLAEAVDLLARRVAGRADGEGSKPAKTKRRARRVVRAGEGR
jgi:DNA topoisomerase-1